MSESTSQSRGLIVMLLLMVTANFVGSILWFISRQKSLAGTANI